MTKNKYIIILLITLAVIVGLLVYFYYPKIKNLSILNPKKAVRGNIDFRNPQQAENITFSAQGAKLAQNNGQYANSGTLILHSYTSNNPQTNWQIIYLKAQTLNQDSIQIRIKTASSIEDLQNNFFLDYPIAWSYGRADFTLKSDFKVGTVSIFKTSQVIQIQLLFNTADSTKTPALNDLSLYYRFIDSSQPPDISEMVVNCQSDPIFSLQNRWQDAANRGQFYSLAKVYSPQLSKIELHMVYDINEYMRFVREFLDNPEALASFQQKFPYYHRKANIANPATNNQMITWEENFAYCYWRGMIPIPQAHAEYYRQKVLTNDTNTCPLQNSDQTILPFWEMPIWLADAYSVSFSKIGTEIKATLPNLPITRDPVTTKMTGPTPCYRVKQDSNGDVIADYQVDVPNATKNLTLQPLVCLRLINNCPCNTLIDLKFNDYYKEPGRCLGTN